MFAALQLQLDVALKANAEQAAGGATGSGADAVGGGAGGRRAELPPGYSTAMKSLQAAYDESPGSLATTEAKKAVLDIVPATIWTRCHGMPGTSSLL